MMLGECEKLKIKWNSANPKLQDGGTKPGSYNISHSRQPDLCVFDKQKINTNFTSWGLNFLFFVFL